MEETYDVIIIGAGQAGLALGKAFKDAGYSFVILEAQKEIGAHWKNHYDSLLLFTPRRWSTLPGLVFPGDPETYPTKDEFAAYLKEYAEHFALPVVLGARVSKLTKDGDVFTARVGRKTYRARQVVIATGYAKPWTLSSDGSIFSLHSSEYRNPQQIPNGRVLVVGGGNSAAQIAVELSKTNSVDLSYQESPRFISTKYFGKSFYFWSNLFRANRIPSDTRVGKFFARDKDFVVGYDALAHLYDGRIRRKAPTLRIRNGKVMFANGAAEHYDAVIWATGFSAEYSWLQVAGALDEKGNPLHRRGVSAVPGLYFIGLRNQITNISGNIHGTHINTPYIVKKIQEARI